MTRQRVVIATIFGLAGLLSGVATLAAIRAAEIMLLVAPSIIFAVCVFLAIKTCQNSGLVAPIPKGRFLTAIGVLVSAYPAALTVLSLVYSLSGWVLQEALGPPSYDRFDLFQLVVFAIGLAGGALTAAFLLWFSATVLVREKRRSLGWAMAIGAVVLALVVLMLDCFMKYRWGLPLESETRGWVVLATIFLLGDSLFSFLYGLGLAQLRVTSTEPSIST